MRVARPITPDDAAPSVQSHYRTFVPTMSNSAPVLRLGTQALARATRLRISLCIGATGSYVPHPRLNQDHAAFMPDASGAVDRSPSTCFAGQSLRPGFDVTWGLSTRPQRFTYVRLPDSYLTEFPPPFSTTLTTTTLDRRRLPRFEACACTPTSRDLPSSWMKHRLHHCRDGDVRSTQTPDPFVSSSHEIGAAVVFLQHLCVLTSHIGFSVVQIYDKTQRCWRIQLKRGAQKQDSLG